MGCAGSTVKSTGNHHAITNLVPASAAGNQHKYEAFLSHDWGKDELGRNNHDRVKRIFQALKQRGLCLWFDEVYMEGDIDEAMCKGIDESAIMIIFITKRYMQKVAGDDAGDNCKKEFNYAKQTRGSGRMLSVVMEPQCRDTNTWLGQVKMYMGSRLYVDFSEDADFDTKVEMLKSTISAMLGGDETAATASATEPNANTMAPPAKAIPRAVTGDVAIEEQLMEKLREYELEHIAPALASNGFHTIRKVDSMDQDDVKELGLPRGDAKDFGRMRQALEEDQRKRREEQKRTEEDKRFKDPHEFERNIEALKAQKNFAAIVSGMKFHAMHAGIQEKACRAFLDLARSDADNKVRIAEAGGIPLILAALDKHATHAGVAESACWAVINLTAKNDDNKLRIAQAGGIPLILAALDIHATHAGVVENACWAVLNVGSAGNRALIAEAGGIPLILAALDNHATNASVVDRACWAVLNLTANNADNQVLTAEAGGIPLILAALDTHATDAGVVENACWALCNIGSSDKALQKSIKEAGAETWVRAAVDSSDATAKTREKGQMLLDHLAQV